MKEGRRDQRIEKGKRIDRRYARYADYFSGLRPDHLEAILLPASSLRGLRVHLLDNLREGPPDVLLFLQAALQPRLEFVMDLRRLPTLDLSHDRADCTALRGPRLAMPLQRVAAGKKISAMIAK